MDQLCEDCGGPAVCTYVHSTHIGEADKLVCNNCLEKAYRVRCTTCNDPIIRNTVSDTCYECRTKRVLDCPCFEGQECTVTNTVTCVDCDENPSTHDVAHGSICDDCTRFYEPIYFDQTLNNSV